MGRYARSPALFTHPGLQIVSAGTARPDPVAAVFTGLAPTNGAGGTTAALALTGLTNEPNPAGAAGGSTLSILADKPTADAYDADLTISIPSGTAVGDLLIAGIVGTGFASGDLSVRAEYGSGSAAVGDPTITVTKPSSCAEGDLLVCIGESNLALQANWAMSGWTNRGNLTGSGSPASGLVVWTKVAGGSEPASYTITGLNDTTESGAAVIVCVNDSISTPVWDGITFLNSAGPYTFYTDYRLPTDNGGILIGAVAQKESTSKGTDDYAVVAPFTEIAEVTGPENTNIVTGYHEQTTATSERMRANYSGGGAERAGTTMILSVLPSTGVADTIAASGWTKQKLQDSPSSGTRTYLFTRVADGSEGASKTFTGLAGETSYYTGGIVCLHDSAGSPTYVETLGVDCAAGPVLDGTEIAGPHAETEIIVVAGQAQAAGSTGAYAPTSPLVELVDHTYAAGALQLWIGHTVGAGPYTPEITYSGNGEASRRAAMIETSVDPSTPGGGTGGVGAASVVTPVVTVNLPTATGTTPPLPTGLFTIGPKRAVSGGNRIDILNPNGDKVWIRGANVGAGAFSGGGSCVGHSTEAQQWNWNSIRLCGYMWNNFGENYLAEARTVINEFTAKGIIVNVADWTMLARWGTYPAEDIYQNVMAGFVTLANEYKNNPYVWLEPWNEPPILGDNNAYVDWERRTIADIRATGFQNIIVVDARGPAQECSWIGGPRLDTAAPAIRAGFDRNILFSWHGYGSCNNTAATMGAWVESLYALDIPLVDGEFGYTTNGSTAAGSYAENYAASQAIMSIAGPKGCGLWPWHATHTDFYSLKANNSAYWVGGASANLSQFGQEFWNCCHNVPAGYL